MKWTAADVKKFVEDIVSDFTHIDALRKKAPVTVTNMKEHAAKMLREMDSHEITRSKASLEYDKLNAKLRTAELLAGKPFIDAVFDEIGRHKMASKLNLEEKFAIAADGVGGFYA